MGCGPSPVIDVRDTDRVRTRIGADTQEHFVRVEVTQMLEDRTR